jgi:hypothetical protein
VWITSKLTPLTKVVPLKRALSIFLSSILVATLFNASATAADSKPTLPLTTPGTFNFGICQSATATECIVSVGVVGNDGTYTPGKHIEDISSPEYKQGENRKLPGRSTWEINNGSNNQKIDVIAEIDTPAHILFGTNTGAALRVFVDNAANVSVKVRIVVRTSWLKPQNVQLVAENADFVQKKVTVGNEWTFEGSKTQIFNYTNWEEARKSDYMAKADVEMTSLRFFIHHVGVNDQSSFFPTACADKGYTVQSWNSEAAGTPYWDKPTNSLNFGIVAPHLKTNGEQNTGFFVLWAQEDFIKCRWPENTLIGAARITVEVLNPDGTQQVAVTSVKQANKTLYFSASGFHYSSPTIRVAAQKAVATPTVSKAPAPVAKKTSITCVKGKSSKKVTAVKPQCPAGWKKK